MCNSLYIYVHAIAYMNLWKLFSRSHQVLKEHRTHHFDFFSLLSGKYGSSSMEVLNQTLICISAILTKSFHSLQEKEDREFQDMPNSIMLYTQEIWTVRKRLALVWKFPSGPPFYTSIHYISCNKKFQIRSKWNAGSIAPWKQSSWQQRITSTLFESGLIIIA